MVESEPDFVHTGIDMSIIILTGFRTFWRSENHLPPIKVFIFGLDSLDLQLYAQIQHIGACIGRIEQDNQNYNFSDFVHNSIDMSIIILTQFSSDLMHSTVLRKYFEHQNLILVVREVIQSIDIITRSVWGVRITG